MGSWMNSDGLYLEYGTTKTSVEKAGTYRTNGELREVELTLTLSEVGTSPAIVSNTQIIPSGVKIQQVVVVASTAAVGATAVLNLGLQKLDRSTQIDYDGIIAALPVASIDATGEQTTLTPGATYAGALLGTTTGADPGYLVADYDTAAFTAGVLRIRIQYYQDAVITQ